MLQTSNKTWRRENGEERNLGIFPDAAKRNRKKLYPIISKEPRGRITEVK